MSPGATFERVYHGLKEQLGSGRYAAGQHLEPAALSQDLASSITPVRDALHRLVGEGLVEAPRGDGFRTPFVTEVGLRHLYRWNAALLDLATRSRRGATAMHETHRPQVENPLDLTERLFAIVAGISGNPEHVRAVARLNDRLRPIRRVELELLHRPAEELTALWERLAEGAVGKLRRSIAVYHQKRERLAAEVVETLHRTV